MHTFCQKLSKILELIAGVLFFSLFFILVLNIVLRNTLNVTWLWIPAVARFHFVWMILIGTTVLYYNNDHLVMDFLVTKWSAKRKSILNLIIEIFFVFFMLVTIIFGLEITRVRMGIPFETWKIPTAYMFASLPIMSFIMLIFSIDRIIILLRDHKGSVL